MKMVEASMVRIYMSENRRQLEQVMARLHDRERVRGVSVFRAIEGYGDSGRIRGASLVDLSLDLPIVVEFFDDPERVDQTLAHLEDLVAPGHVVQWSVRMNVADSP